MSIIKQTSTRLVLQQTPVGLLRGVGLSFIVSGLSSFVGLAAILAVFAVLSGVISGREFFIVGRQTLSNDGMLITLSSIFIILFLSVLAYAGLNTDLFTPTITCTFDGTTGFVIVEQQKWIGLSRIIKYSFSEISGIGVESASRYDSSDNHDIFLVLRSTQRRVPIIRYATSREAQRVSQTIAAFVGVRYYGLFE